MLERRDRPVLREPLHVAVPAGLEEPPRHARQRAGRVPREAVHRTSVVSGSSPIRSTRSSPPATEPSRRRQRRVRATTSTAARTPDGKLAMAYLPTVRTVTIDTSKLAANAVAQLVRPDAGTFTPAAPPPRRAGATETFRPPDKNSDGRRRLGARADGRFALNPMRAPHDRRRADAAHRRRTRARRGGGRAVPRVPRATAASTGSSLSGTTGEGILLSVAEREAPCSSWLRRARSPVIAHCGAQTTADTVALAAHAAEAGVAGVAVIAPPYFLLDEDELLAHFVAAARACAPTAVLRLRARAGVRLRDPGRGRRAAPRDRRQPGRDEGERRAVREGAAVHARRARRAASAPRR